MSIRFYVTVRNADGRLILTRTKRDNPIQHIYAPDWITARARVDVPGMYHNPGQGWFK